MDETLANEEPAQIEYTITSPSELDEDGGEVFLHFSQIYGFTACDSVTCMKLEVKSRHFMLPMRPKRNRSIVAVK